MTVALDGAKHQRLHAVVLPYPAKGHSIPLLHFAERLRAMGVTVTFVNVFNHLSEEVFRSLKGVEHTSMRVVPLGDSSVQPGGGSLPYLKHIERMEPEAELLLESLFAQDPELPPDCIVTDMFLGWTQVIANKFNIPKYVLYASPASALSCFLHAPELARQGVIPTNSSRGEEMIYDIPGVPPTRAADLPSPLQDSSDYLYDFFLRNAKQMQEAAGVLVNTYYELEPNCIDVLRKTTFQEGHSLSILPVGPLLPNSYFSTSMTGVTGVELNREPCLQWLDKQPDRSVVFVSFGSVAVLSIPQIHEIALGLEGTGQRFLLAIRAPENPDNQPLLPELFEERTQGRGFVLLGWAPQLYILSHPSLAGFVSHCGWNSTLESICRGVPLLTWPIQAEQAMNARFLVDVVKAALEVCKVTDKFVVRDTLAKAVRRLMTDPEGEAVKINVKKLQSLALQAVAEGGSVQKNFQNFVEEVQAYNRRPSLKFLDNNHATLGDEDELEAAPELQPLNICMKEG